MATVLYITSNPQNHDKSFSLSVGNRFIQAYRAAHPFDEVVHLDLYKMDVPQLDADVFNGWDKLRAGAVWESLTPAEQEKVSRLGELADQFAAADKYVFVNPIWNYSYPPVMKAYIDSICVSGKSFEVLPGKGYAGLLGGKKAVHIQASGSALSPGSAGADREAGHRHLATVMKFLGISDFESIFVEGMAVSPDQAQTIKEKAIERASDLALSF